MGIGLASDWQIFLFVDFEGFELGFFALGFELGFTLGGLTLCFTCSGFALGFKLGLPFSVLFLAPFVEQRGDFIFALGDIVPQFFEILLLLLLGLLNNWKALFTETTFFRVGFIILIIVFIRFSAIIPGKEAPNHR